MDPQQIADILTACLDHGFAPPLYVCAVSVNGAVLAVRYVSPEAQDEGWGVEVLAEHYPDPGFVLPVNMMVTDTRGEAVRVVLRTEGWNFADLN